MPLVPPPRPPSGLRRVALAALLCLAMLFALWLGYAKVNEAALRTSGYDKARDGNPDSYFDQFAKRGLSPESVAAAMPHPAEVQRYVVPVAGSDSMLVERYMYRRGVGSWPVDVYYGLDREVRDLYAWDHASLQGGRRVNEAEARAWPARLRQAARQ